LSDDLEVVEVGIKGRLVPNDTELAAILAALKTTIKQSVAQATPDRVPSWRFANRTWGKHAALLRTRPHRPNSF
jgi:hypothetical protein